MTLAVQLRAAMEYTRDRLAELATEQEALEFVVAAIQDALTLRDSASVQVADGGAEAPGEEQPSPSAISPAAPIHAGAVRVERTPADQDGDAGSTPAPRSSICPGCDRLFPTTRHVGQHRRFCKGRPAAAEPSVPSLVIRVRANEPADEEPITRHWAKRPTIAERVAQRDAGRVGRRVQHGRGGGLGE